MRMTPQFTQQLFTGTKTKKKPVEKIDPTTSKKPFYWKYDKMGRVIEETFDKGKLVKK
jgi:hypothetical protein